ncbi:aldo/keto reductase [Alicyclobacillus fastidiosus]|uniref:Aldo/keto reductase n=1 Tax=Alicyclobacillus fastidiosus TaxID=392011 RepID=A0ABY6ZE28_9BACL|nr:aldo/keto reductase [Alicyclobacillus fastidiosus]WAH41097.1 aldo/keto reductase [Alicyclobacillus fastidiosus]GMA62653.1 oxidoreductase [Alicyclobacillus fastidiosus]
MKYTRLEKSGLEVSNITFGCWELGGGQWEKESDERNIEAIQTAFEMGITSFDTAEGYGQGHSEDIVGAALDGRRKDAVIATKVSPGHLRADDVRRSVEQSIKRLRTDYIDIYYVHWPNKDIPLAETMNEFRRLREENVIKAVAVSNFSLEQLEEAMSVTYVDAIQPEYSLLHRGIEKEVLPYCRDHSIGVLTYSSIAKGILTGAYHLGEARQLSDSDFRRNRRLFLKEHLEQEAELVFLLRDIAEQHGVTPSEIAIAWLLHQKGVTSAIVGTQNIEHLRSNARAVDIQLTNEQLTVLDETSRKALIAIDGR